MKLRDFALGSVAVCVVVAGNENVGQDSEKNIFERIFERWTPVEREEKMTPSATIVEEPPPPPQPGSIVVMGPTSSLDSTPVEPDHTTPTPPPIFNSTTVAPTAPVNTPNPNPNQPPITPIPGGSQPNPPNPASNPTPNLTTGTSVIAPLSTANPTAAGTGANKTSADKGIGSDADFGILSPSIAAKGIVVLAALSLGIVALL